MYCNRMPAQILVSRSLEIVEYHQEGDTALRLGHWFGTTPEFWLNLQTLYELRLARQEVGERVRKLPTLTDHKHKRESTPNRL
jgi:plasmid maintenance system antidote protein VapI